MKEQAKDIVRIALGKKELGKKRIADLNVLITRSTKRLADEWRKNGLDVLKPRCSYCGSLMEFRHSAVVGGNGLPCRDDQAWKCPKCRHTTHFGIPMEYEEVVEEKKLRGGAYLMRPSMSISERNDDEIKQRLKDLGYGWEK